MDFHCAKRSDATHKSSTDPAARLKKKGTGKEVRLVVEGHGLMENRHGSLVDLLVTQVSGTAERNAIPLLLDTALGRGCHPTTRSPGYAVSQRLRRRMEEVVGGWAQTVGRMRRSRIRGVR